MRKALFCFLFFDALDVRAQGFTVNDIVGYAANTSAGTVWKPAPGAAITVCPVTGAVNPTTFVCAPKSTIYTDYTLSVPKTNPTNADAQGNYSYSVPAGTYLVTFTATGLGHRQQIVTLDVGGGTVTLNQTFITVDNETATLANSSQLIAGDNITLDTSTPNQIIINSLTGMTRKVCIMRTGADDGDALEDANIAPQTFQCKITDTATLIEVDVHADDGTPTVIVARDRNGASADIISATLTTAASGGEACANASGGLSIDGTTTCSATIQNTGFLAGDYLYARTATAGGVAKLFTISVIFTQPAGGSGAVTSLMGTANQIAVDANTGDVTISIPTNPTLPGTTTGTFVGDITGNLLGDAFNTTTQNLGVTMGLPEIVITAGHIKLNGDLELDPSNLIIRGMTSGAVTIKVEPIATTFNAVIPAIGSASHFLLLPDSVTPVVGQCFTVASVTPLTPGVANCGGGGGGTGNVVGPATNTNLFFPRWNGANSLILSDGLAGASAATATTVVIRDASANFAGNVITGASFVGPLTGNVTGNLTGNVTGNVTGALTGNASTATAAASNPADCGANTFAQSIVASWALTCAAVDLSTADVTGNLAVTHLNSGTLADNTHFWRGDGTWAVPAGAGAGTVMSVAMTSLAPLFTTVVNDPTNAVDIQLSLTNAAGGTLFGRATGTTGAPSYSSTPVLGIAGSVVGTLGFRNATSGELTLSPPTGALGTVTVTIPASTDTLVNLAGMQTLSNKTFVAPALGTPVSVVLTNATGLPLSTGVTGNLPVTNLNGGTGASITTFWRGDGTWSAGAAGLNDPGGNGFVSRTALNTTVNRTLTPGTGIGITNQTGVAGDPVISQNTANLRRTCTIVVGTDNASVVIANSDLGPQGRQCYIPYAATVVEIMVAADAGTPNVIVGRNLAGVIANLTSSALGTGGSGGLACSNVAGTTGLDGATTCSATLQNTAITAGGWLQLVSGTAGAVAKRISIAITYTVN